MLYNRKIRIVLFFFGKMKYYNNKELMKIYFSFKNKHYVLICAQFVGLNGNGGDFNLFKFILNL